MNDVLKAIEDSRFGLTKYGIMAICNMSFGRIEKCLKMLEIDGTITKEGTKYIRTLNSWKPDLHRSEQITALRRHELNKMRDFVDSKSCLMAFVSKELDDPYAGDCGKCANCIGRGYFPLAALKEDILEAIKFLKRDSLKIKPRKRWPTGGVSDLKGAIPLEKQNMEGFALSAYGDAGWGRLVKDDKYIRKQFSDELINASAELIRNWRPIPVPAWVTYVPSLRRPELVAGFAYKLAEKIGLPCLSVIRKAKNNPEQKTMQNSLMQAANIAEAFEIFGECPDAPVILIDDMVDSRWTLTICGFLLRQNGCGPVFPFVLANSAGGDGNE